MLHSVHPKLPMRNKEITRTYYVDKLHFQDISKHDYPGYLILKKDAIELHFFEFKELNPYENYGQVYIRTDKIERLYQTYLDYQVRIHPNGFLDEKPWGQREFSILDPDHNLIIFGEVVAD